MIEYEEVERSPVRIRRQGRRWLWKCTETGITGDVDKRPGEPWVASIPGSWSLASTTCEEAVRRILAFAVAKKEFS